MFKMMALTHVYSLVLPLIALSITLCGTDDVGLMATRHLCHCEILRVK